MGRSSYGYKTMNPVIFLDIDGVLNHSGIDFKYYEIQIPKNLGFWTIVEFSPNNIFYFNKLIDTLGEDKVDIVISSSWRTIYSLEELQIIFKEMNIKGNLIGITPKLSFKKRGYEINQYIKENKIKHFCIIDDNSDMEFSYLFERFVQTNFLDQENGGFREKHIKEVLQKINY